MGVLKNLVSRNFQSLAYFYRYLRYRVFVSILLSISVGVFDGIGLTMFLPLLQMVDGESQANPEGLGKLSFLIDGLQEVGISLTMTNVLVVLVFFFLLKGLFKFLSHAYKVTLLQYFIRRIRLNMLNALNSVSFKSFVKSDAGRIQNTMTGEVDRVSRSYTHYFNAVQQIAMVLVYMVFAFFVDARFALLVSIGGGVSNLLYKIIYKRTKGRSKKLTKDSNIFQGQIIQHIANFKYLKATGMLQRFANLLKGTILKIEESRKRIGIMSGVLLSAREPMMIGVVSAVIIFQIQVLGGSLAPILLSLLFFYRALTALLIMQESWNRFLEVSGSLDNLMDFQKQLSFNVEKSGDLPFTKFKNKIVVSRASFRYDYDYILKDLDLTILRNETIAFVGKSGSGKTTLVNVLAGLLPVDQGSVLIDGINVREINVKEFQRRIGYITQEAVIFNDSVFNNVSLWDDPIPENILRAEQSMKQAVIYDFVRSQPAGIDTLLGNNGINLSGGQRQRISIARELYKDIDILIMDEATSALDSETERNIQEAIDSLHGRYTILIVAHRLSTIKNSDRIVFMKRGVIESIDTYSDLLDKNNEFRRMVEMQEI